MVSGHVHLFEMIKFSDGRPPQIIAGGGATELDHYVDTNTFKNGISRIKADLGNSEVLNIFTFAYVDFEKSNRKVTVVDQLGTARGPTFTVDY